MSKGARWMRTAGMALAVSLMGMTVAMASMPTRPADAEAVERHGKNGVSVTGTVFFGDRSAFSKAATIDEAAVFAEIPAYQRIIKEKVKPETALYHFLLRQANKVFKAALKKAAKAAGHDLVVEQGGIVVRKETIPDITQNVIDAIDA